MGPFVGFSISHDLGRSWTAAPWVPSQPIFGESGKEGRNEFFAGHGAGGSARWANGIENSRPLLSWPGHCGCVTATFVPALGRYLMCVTDGWPTIKQMTSYMLESELLTGPWRVVNYLRDFGPQGYFLNIPSRFISPDGSTMWLSYSANFTNSACGTSFEPGPPGSRYSMCMQELTLLR